MQIGNIVRFLCVLILGREPLKSVEWSTSSDIYYLLCPVENSWRIGIAFIDESLLNDAKYHGFFSAPRFVFGGIVLILRCRGRTTDIKNIKERVWQFLAGESRQLTDARGMAIMAYACILLMCCNLSDVAIFENLYA